MITVTGENGSILIGDNKEMFYSPNLPETITSIYMSNIAAYKGFTDQKPSNNFWLLLDFSKPLILDNNNPLSGPTPNNSALDIEGSSDAWVATISDAVIGVLEGKKTHVHGYTSHSSMILDL